MQVLFRSLSVSVYTGKPIHWQEESMNYHGTSQPQRMLGFVVHLHTELCEWMTCPRGRSRALQRWFYKVTASMGNFSPPTAATGRGGSGSSIGNVLHVPLVFREKHVTCSQRWTYPLTQCLHTSSTPLLCFFWQNEHKFPQTLSRILWKTFPKEWSKDILYHKKKKDSILPPAPTVCPIVTKRVADGTSAFQSWDLPPNGQMRIIN